MAFHGLTFPNQNVSSLDDGGFYRSFRGDGIIQGCEITFTTDSITIQAGWLIAGGRLIQVDGATTFTFEDMITTGYGRLMLQIDTSQASTVEDFAQLSYLFDYSASIDGFTAPVQEDINLGGGAIYQTVLAVVTIGNGNITEINSSLGFSWIDINAIAVTSDGRIVPRINFVGDDGVPVGALMSPALNNGDMRLYGLDEGTQTSGLYMEKSGRLILFGHGDVVVRPNGATNTSGQVYWDTDGDQHGGHKRITKSFQNVNVPTANVVTAASNLQVTKAGLYEIHFYGDFNPSASATGIVNFGIGFGSGTARSAVNSCPLTGGTHIYSDFPIFAQMAANEYIYVNVQAAQKGTISGAINAVLLG